VDERRERLERALRGCAEEGVPDGVDLWPRIRECVGQGRPTGTQVSEERAASDTTSRAQRRWPSRLVPNTPLGYALAVVSVLIVGAAAYAASGPVGELLRYGLPGPAGPGVGEHTGGVQPDDGLPGLRTEIGQTRTQDGARVVLDWAYADEKFVAVGLNTQDLDGAEGSGRSDPGSGSTILEPSLWDDTEGNEAEFPPHIEITDASDQDFDTVGGGTGLGPRGTGAEAVFDAPEGLEPGRGPRFRLEVPIEGVSRPPPPQEAPSQEEEKSPQKETPTQESAAPPRDLGPFVFVFDVPVSPAPIIEVNQKAEAEGIEITLERVVNSPLLPQAVVCFEPPDDEHQWMPWLQHDGDSTGEVRSAPQNLGEGCWSLEMGAPVEGSSSVTVAQLEGMPRADTLPDGNTFRPKIIRGPWVFEFEAPDP
jgi:hypothetical protein